MINDSGSAAVAVIGGGWAGCAAAVELAQCGMRVTLFEQARVLGGRARRIGIEGITLDNGQHVCVGGYRRTLALVDTVHGTKHARTLFHRLPLMLRPYGVRRMQGASFTAWRAPAPLHLIGGILATRNVSWRDRYSLVHGFQMLRRLGFRCPTTQTVAECFASAPERAMNAFWSPLCLAALNTRPERASAQIFANVLRAAFTGRAVNSSLLLPATDLSTLFPDAAMRYIEARGGSAHLGATVRALHRDGNNVLVTTNSGQERFAAAIVAVGPHQLADLVSGDTSAEQPWQSAARQVASFHYQSITTVYLAYGEPVAMPAPMMRLNDAPGQWLFDRSAALAAAPTGKVRALLAVVISASDAQDELDQRTLAATVDAQLRQLAPSLSTLAWARVVTERRATYACTPSLERPSGGRIAPGFYLAGDYTHADLPATLEAATQSGVAAAQAALSDLRNQRH